MNLFLFKLAEGSFSHVSSSLADQIYVLEFSNILAHTLTIRQRLCYVCPTYSLFVTSYHDLLVRLMTIRNTYPKHPLGGRMSSAGSATNTLRVALL